MAHAFAPNLHDLPLEVLTHVCRHLGLCDLVRVSQSCKRFRHGGTETVELPTQSPVVAVLLDLAFSRLELAPRTRPVGCSESWVAFPARSVRHRGGKAPPIAVSNKASLLVNAAAQEIMACATSIGVGHGNEDRYTDPTPVGAMTGVKVRSVAAGDGHSLALTWDGRVY
jgi:hypothetical protein